MYGFGYALSGAEGVESEPAAAVGTLRARTWHGDKGLCGIAWHPQCVHVCWVWPENTLGLCEERQSPMNYNICLDTILVASAPGHGQSPEENAQCQLYRSAVEGVLGQESECHV